MIIVKEKQIGFKDGMMCLIHTFDSSETLLFPLCL